MNANLTNRETALLHLAMSGSDTRDQAIEACRVAMGRPLVTVPTERANVAAVLADRGFDGMGRVELALADMNAAAAADTTLPEVVRR